MMVTPADELVDAVVWRDRKVKAMLEEVTSAAIRPQISGDWSPELGKATSVGESGGRGGAPGVSLRAWQHEEPDGDGFGVVVALEEALGGEVWAAEVGLRCGAAGACGNRSRGRRRLRAVDVLLR